MFSVLPPRIRDLSRNSRFETHEVKSNNNSKWLSALFDPGLEVVGAEPFGGKGANLEDMYICINVGVYVVSL